MKERSLYDSEDLARSHMFQGDAQLIKDLEETYIAVQTELTQLREAKELNIVEEHVRERVREQLDEIESSKESKALKRKTKIVKE